MSQEAVIEEMLHANQRQREHEIIQTMLFDRYASDVFQSYDRWKSIPEFYFIPIRMNLGYYGTDGFYKLMAPPPYWLGTIVRNSLENPTLFAKAYHFYGQERHAYAYKYGGSPISDIFYTYLTAPPIGDFLTWKGRRDWGWKERSKVLSATQNEDKSYMERLLKDNPLFKSSSMFEMLGFIGIPEDELRSACPSGPDDRIRRSVGPYGEVTLFDEWGGAAIISNDTLFLRYWDGPLDPITEERSLWSIKKICIDP